MNPTYDFTGQVTMITGASSGIGLASQAFAAAGAAVVTADINTDALTRHADTLTAAGHRALPATCDVAAELEASRHRRILRTPRDGRILSSVMLRPFASSLPRGHAVLTTTRRKPGSVVATLCGRSAKQTPSMSSCSAPSLGHVAPLGGVSLVWNLRANPNVGVRLGLPTITDVGREIDHPVELDRAKAAIARPCTSSTMANSAFICGAAPPTRAKIKHLQRYWFENRDADRDRPPNA